MRYKASMSNRKNAERAHAAADAGDYGGQDDWPFEDSGEDVGSQQAASSAGNFEGGDFGADGGHLDSHLDGLVALMLEANNRLNDFRQAAAGGRPQRSDGRAADARRSLGPKEIPARATCKGRHSVKVCPNEAARRDANFDLKAAFQNEQNCGHSGR